ncbi:hypothetical protein [uncultured Polaribacter sp.]|uniref:hypothetical protein n=1 Tax=uncultured Polaribacter sp. TaxID=174711 RepID=UPI002609DE7F|nr:hypothetical protein [uncultured Polaribacter sp.]
MNKENNNIDFLEYELDGMNTIGILNESLFYENQSYSGDIEETEIPLKNINKIEFKPKRINRERTKSNLIGDFIWTILDSGAHPTEVEYDMPELIIHFRNENGIRKDILKIKNRNLTEKIYKEIKSKIY